MLANKEQKDKSILRNLEFTLSNGSSDGKIGK
jgi:hypothetical protein